MIPETFHIVAGPATAGSVFRASTGTKVAHIFVGLEEGGWGCV
jgi:hypothetical protein